MNKKQLKAYEQLELQSDIEIPLEISKLLGTLKIKVAGNQLCLSDKGDFGTLEEFRALAKFLVDQLGGTVTWSYPVIITTGNPTNLVGRSGTIIIK